MKKIISLFMALGMVLSLAACSTNQSPRESTPEKQPDSSAEAQQPTDEAGKTLVVYYSATGNTENVANYIATATDGDLFELEPAEPYSDADLNWTDDNSRVVREHDNPDERDVPLVKSTVDNWGEYDTVFIGYPIWWGIALTAFLTLLIIFLVYGFDKKTLAASSGALLGVLVTCIIGCIFTEAFKIHGAVMAYSESLLYAGYQKLNLSQIYMSGIFIGASGAMMDLSVDITSAVNEVIEKKPDIGWKEAARSGMNVGRAAMGTMTTTLLLAYSGGYIALLMTFMAQGTPIDNILNYKYVAAELLDTIVGSFGLVTVAPFTALTSAWLLTKKKK